MEERIFEEEKTEKRKKKREETAQISNGERFFGQKIDPKWTFEKIAPTARQPMQKLVDKRAYDAPDEMVIIKLSKRCPKRA